ncbi:MAG: protein phosphatase 2C domain-containing protein [Bacteroidales bacterium]|nr:protein phosphatase 2C domain-containing protein [Bacteroidales bacterium]
MVEAVSFSEIGERPQQEDALWPAPGCATTADRVFIVCDGMGGHEAGEVASQTVCQAVSQSLLKQLSEADDAYQPRMLTVALDKAFTALDACRGSGSTADRRMGTTLALLILYDGCHRATIAHIGDSRVYHFRPGPSPALTRLLHVTADHSLVGVWVAQGIMTPEEARQSPMKNVITKALQPALGADRPEPTVYDTGDIVPGDYFFLCSDGMLEHIDDQQLCFYFSDLAGQSPLAKAAKLKLATQGNHDNHSAILVLITDVDSR